MRYNLELFLFCLHIEVCTYAISEPRLVFLDYIYFSNKYKILYLRLKNKYKILYLFSIFKSEDLKNKYKKIYLRWEIYIFIQRKYKKYIYAEKSIYLSGVNIILHNIHIYLRWEIFWCIIIWLYLFIYCTQHTKCIVFTTQVICAKFDALK